MARRNATVDPLPLVPATWITGGRWFWGAPRRASIACIRPSDRSIFFGCSAMKRAMMASESVISTGSGKVPGLCRRFFRRLGQEATQSGERRLQLMAMHDHVDHAVLLEIFGALEAVGQLFADG